MAGTIDDNIAQLFSFAEDALGEAKFASNRISGAEPMVASAHLDYTLEKPERTPPASMADLLSPDNSSSTIQFLNGESEKWLDKFFPEIQAGCLTSSPEEWLCGILTGQKPFGLSKEVFEAVWHESRDREYRARNASVRQLNAEFSARGFTLPVGAHIAAITRAERDASDAIGSVNRAQTMRDAEIKLDLLKFAEEQAIRLKLGIMQAMADFYRQWIELPNKDLEASRIRTQAYASFQDALSSFWRVELGFEELRLQAENLRMNGRLDENRLRVSAVTGDSRNAALAQATRAYGGVASAASSAASTINACIISG